MELLNSFEEFFENILALALHRYTVQVIELGKIEEKL